MGESLYLIVGVGNTLRHDDGAGIWLAEAAARALAEQGKAVELRLLQQLLPEMAEEICELKAQTVLIADCSVGSYAERAGWVRRLQPAENDGPERQLSEDSAAIVGIGSHGLGAAALIELARCLYGFEGEAWLATVPGVDFDHGEGLSPTTRQAIDHLVPAILGLIT